MDECTRMKKAFALSEKCSRKDKLEVFRRTLPGPVLDALEEVPDYSLYARTTDAHPTSAVWPTDTDKILHPDQISRVPGRRWRRCSGWWERGRRGGGRRRWSCDTERCSSHHPAVERKFRHRRPLEASGAPGRGGCACRLRLLGDMSRSRTGCSFFFWRSAGPAPSSWRRLRGAPGPYGFASAAVRARRGGCVSGPLRGRKSLQFSGWSSWVGRCETCPENHQFAHYVYSRPNFAGSRPPRPKKSR